MAELAFLDANVIVYAMDRSDPTRQRTAAALVGALLEDRRAIISVQVLREFYVIATRKIAAPLTHAAAREVIEDLRALTVVDESSALLADALDILEEARLSLWDALIVAAAARAGCTVLYSEDMAHGQVIRGVRIHNPFFG